MSEHIYTMEEFYSYGDRLHLNTVIDIAVNSFAAFIVLKHSTKAMGNYKYYILLTIFSAFLMDFHISFIFGPFMMLPAPLFCGAGFIARNLNHFWGQYIQYALMHVTVSCVGGSLVFGLLYQLSSLNGNVDFFHSPKGIIIIGLTMIFYPTPSFAIIIPMQDFDESAAYIKEYYHMAYDVFVTASSCHALKLDLKGKAHYGTLALQVCIAWGLGGIVAFKIHQKLASMKNILSPATLKARRQLLIALCFQMTIPSILIVFPLVIMLISVIFNARHMSIVSLYAMPIIGFHSLVNACSIMYIITPYRNAIITIMRKLLRLKDNSTHRIVEITTQTHHHVTSASGKLNQRNAK